MFTLEKLLVRKCVQKEGEIERETVANEQKKNNKNYLTTTCPCECKSNRYNTRENIFEILLNVNRELD